MQLHESRFYTNHLSTPPYLDDLPVVPLINLLNLHHRLEEYLLLLREPLDDLGEEGGVVFFQVE